MLAVDAARRPGPTAGWSGELLVLHLPATRERRSAPARRTPCCSPASRSSRVVVVLYLARRVGSRVWAVALGLLLAGVAGNLTDRLFRAPGPLRGHVIDFLDAAALAGLQRRRHVHQRRRRC